MMNSHATGTVATFNKYGLHLRWPRLWIVLLGIILIFLCFSVAGMEIGNTIFDLRRGTTFGGFILFIPLLICGILVVVTGKCRVRTNPHPDHFSTPYNRDCLSWSASLRSLPRSFGQRETYCHFCQRFSSANRVCHLLETDCRESSRRERRKIRVFVYGELRDEMQECCWGQN